MGEEIKRKEEGETRQEEEAREKEEEMKQKEKEIQLDVKFGTPSLPLTSRPCGSPLLDIMLNFTAWQIALNLCSRITSRWPSRMQGAEQVGVCV